MKLCMFHPLDHPLERGWVGRIEGDRVIQLAAQTLQSFFTGGGSAREHAEYRLAEVRLLAPVLHPPAVRIFEDQTTFAFGNPAAILGPGGVVAVGAVRTPSNSLLQGRLALVSRVAGVIGAEGALAGFTAFAEWRLPAAQPPKDRDFAIGLGPAVVTPDELDPEGLDAIVRVNGTPVSRVRVTGFDWSAARKLAEAGTRLLPGDLLAGPAFGNVNDLEAGAVVELEVAGVGALDARLQPQQVSVE